MKHLLATKSMEEASETLEIGAKTSDSETFRSKGMPLISQLLAYNTNELVPYRTRKTK